MSGDWIKMRGSLLTNPKVIRVARALLLDGEFRAWFGLSAHDHDDVTRDVTLSHASSRVVTASDARMIPVVTRVTVGALLPLWISVNECAADDAILRDATFFEVDTIAGVPGFGRALESVGWIEVLPNEEGLQFANFHEYNTVGKQRSAGVKTAAERSRDYREKRRALVTSRHVTAGVTDAVTRHPREEKSREEKEIPPNPPRTGGVAVADSARPTKAGEVCLAIKAKGVTGVSPSNPELQALIDKGVPVETFEDAAEICAKSIPPKGMGYLLGIVKRRLTDAAGIASGAGMPQTPWDENRATIEAKGVELGIGRWNDSDLSADRETFAAYIVRVREAVANEIGVMP